MKYKHFKFFNIMANFIAGGSGNNWFKWGDMWINDSPEGWETAGWYSEMMAAGLTIVFGGLFWIIDMFLGWTGPIMVLLGVLGFIFPAVRKLLSWIWIIGLVGGAIFVACWVLQFFI
jgi:hypothetical protein